MTPPTALSGFVTTFLRILGSTVVGKHTAVNVGGEGMIGGLGAIDGDEPGDQLTDAPQYSAPGLVFRPRPPSTHDGDLLGTEAVALKTAAGDVPIAWRDLRLNRRFPAPKAGTVAFVGYGGGFLSFDDALGGASSKATLYVPYGRSNVEAAATKAMVVAIDPEAESLMLIHGDGYAVVLDKDNGITLRADSSTWLSVRPGKIELVASTISARGSVALGADTSVALPLVAGAGSQPTPSVFFSPT